MPRVALITGSARGIGRALALRLAADGLDIALLDLPASLELLHGVAAEVEKLGRRAHVLTADVTVEAEVQAAVQACAEKLGSLDVMVANAGILHVQSLLSTSVEDLDAIYAVNVRGVFLAYKYAAEQMIAQGRGGRIVGASSMAGKKGYGPILGYCMTKFAVRGMTQSSAEALARHKITVNAYAPGVIESDMGSALEDGYKGLGIDPAALTPLVGRHGTAEEVAALVSYLVSDAAAFITGQTISINGGAYFE